MATTVAPPAPRTSVDPLAAVPTTSRVRCWPVVAALVPGLLAAVWAALPTTWDGASFLFRVAHTGDPEILHGRVGSIVWQLPGVLAARSGASLPVVREMFSLGWVVAPLVALWLSWLVVRDRDPRLFACAACGIVALSAPSQAFFVGEMLITLQLGWVLLLTAATGATTTWGRRLVVPVALVMLVTHPTSAFVIAAAAGILLMRWLADGHGRVTRRQGTLVGGLVMLAVLRMLLTNGYERANTQDSAFDVAMKSLEQGGVLLVLGIVCIGAAVVAMAFTVGTRWAQGREWLPFALLALGGASLVVMVSDTARWQWEVNWRVFNLVFMAPAVAALVVCIFVPAASSAEARRKAGAFAVGCAVLASAVLIVQSVQYRDARSDLRDELRALPPSCVVLNDLPSAAAAPLASHWGVAMLALEEQGFRPRVMVLDTERRCRTYTETGDARLWPWNDVVRDRGAGGAFRLPAL